MSNYGLLPNRSSKPNRHHLAFGARRVVCSPDRDHLIDVPRPSAGGISKPMPAGEPGCCEHRAVVNRLSTRSQPVLYQPAVMCFDRPELGQCWVPGS